MKSDRALFIGLNVIVAIAFVVLVSSPSVSSSRNGVQSAFSFILFWCPLPIFWGIGLVMKKGVFSSFVWALLWFFGTGLVAFAVSIMIHGLGPCL